MKTKEIGQLRSFSAQMTLQLADCEENVVRKSKLKEIIIETISEQCEFTPEELESYSWLIWALDLQNN